MKVTLHCDSSYTFYSGESDMLLSVSSGSGGLIVNGESSFISRSDYFIITKKSVFSLANVANESLEVRIYDGKK